MTRSNATVLGLLITAWALVAAVAAQGTAAGEFPPFAAVGFAIGQIVLASAALVFCTRMLWLRLFALLAAMGYGSWLLSAAMPGQPLSLPLLSVLLLACAWFGLLRLIGWRADEESSATTKTGQFSLATVMLGVTIFGIYLGLLQGVSTHDGGDFRLTCIFLTIASAGCLAPSAIHGRRAIRLVSWCIILIGYSTLALLDSERLLLPNRIAEAAMIAVSVEVPLVMAVFVVVKWVRADTQSAQPIALAVEGIVPFQRPGGGRDAGDRADGGQD